MEEEIIKSIKALNDTLTINFKYEFFVGLISSLIGTAIGATLAFWYSDKIQRKQARYNFLIDSRDKLIENHFFSMSNFDSLLKIKNEKSIKSSNRNDLLKQYSYNFNLSVAKIQVIAQTLSRNDPIFTEVAKYTDLLVRLLDVIESDDFKDIEDISQLVWNFGPKDEKGEFTNAENMQTCIINQMLNVLDLINLETSKYINK